MSKDTIFTIDKQFVFQYKENFYENIKNRFFFFNKEKKTTWKLQLNEDLTIKKGFIAILGESGSGKSTLISILSGFEKLSPEQKSQIAYFVNDDYKIKFSEKELKKIRKNNFGYIFQRCYEAKSLTAKDNIALPLIIKKFPYKIAYKYCSNLLSSLKMENLSNAPANELSGGQLTRIGILRGIAQTPKIIFADEPANNLDSENAERILSILNSWKEQTSGTVIMVTHHLKHALKYADQIIIFKSSENQSSNVVFQKHRNSEQWSKEDKHSIGTTLKINEKFTTDFPSEQPQKQKPNFISYLLFLTKAARKNITSKADGSRAISIITFLAFLTLFSIFFFGNQLISWFETINTLKNNTAYLRKFEITVQHPPGLSSEVQNVINNLKVEQVRDWLIKKIDAEMDEIEKTSQVNKYLSFSDYIFKHSNSLTTTDNQKKISTITAILNEKNHDTLDIYQKYGKYLSAFIHENQLNPTINLKTVKRVERNFRNVIRLIEFLVDIHQIKGDALVGNVYPRWDSGPEFVKKNGDRNNRTTTMRWLHHNDPFYNDPRFKYIDKADFRFSSNNEDGIIIDKETLVDELGYEINDTEVKILYGNREKACIPVKAVVERMPEPEKYRVLTTFGFGEKIRAATHHCKDKQKYYKVKINIPKDFDFSKAWEALNLHSNKDKYDNTIINYSKVSDHLIDLYCDNQYAKTESDWKAWVSKNIFHKNNNNFELSVNEELKMGEATGKEPPFKNGTIYTNSKNMVPALGEYLTLAYREKHRETKWRISAYGYEDKIKYAKQSEVILENIKSIGFKILGFLFLLFLSTNMIINIRNKAPEIAIFRAMGASILSLLIIFNIQVLMILICAAFVALFFVFLIGSYTHDFFINTIIQNIWKNPDEQREAVAAISSNTYYEQIVSLIHINDIVLISSLFCVVVCVTIMILYVQISPNHAISKVLRER